MKIWITALFTFILIHTSVLAGQPLVQVTFQVIDDAGTVVTGATVRMTTFKRWVPGPEFGKDIQAHVEGQTDTNGLITLQLPSIRGSVKYGVSVNGEYFDNTMKMNVAGETYYRDMGGSVNFTDQVSGKWQPWNPIIKIELKRVVDPIPMLARSFINSWPRLQIPEFDKNCGFDLMKGDWIQPYGAGEIADISFRLNVVSLGRRKIDRGPMYDATFVVTFSDDDGFQDFFVLPQQGSVFRSPYFAPETGYKSEVTKKSYEHETDSYDEKREDQNYIYRIRTKRNEFGNITSAFYGKIYGDIKYNSRGELRFLYYLNPMPNDRNMEFDPSQNLFTDLRPTERVTDP